MAKELAKLFVTLGVDDKELQKGLNKAQKTMGAWGKGLATAGGFITAAVAGIGGASLKMAMDAVESENLFEVSMKGMAKAARSWSEETSDALGLNEYELRKNIGTLFNMTNNMGLAQDAAYDMSKGLTQLAYDMASFYNLAPEEAFQKLQAGITGETEPLKRLGILVDENTIKQVAYAAGIAEAGSQLTQKQKVQARYLAIMQQTSDAQGDLARTLDSPINRLRIFKSQIEETGIKLGEALLPGLQKIMDIMSPIISSISNWVSENPELARTILVITGVIGGLALALGILGMAIGPIAAALTLMLGPIGLIIAAVIALGVAAYFIIKHWEDIINFFKTAWGTVTDFIVAPLRVAWEAVGRGINWLIEQINKIKFEIPNWVPGIGGKGWEGFKLEPVTLPKFHTGGIIPGRPGQEVPVMAMAGEIISRPGQGGITNNFNISGLVVREEADIDRIARQLYRLQQVRA